MGRAFCAHLGEAGDDHSMVLTAKSLIDSEDSILLMDDGAMAAALVYPHFFNTDVKIAQELFWWVDEDRRGTGVAIRLLNGLEDWARGAGAKSLTMISMGGGVGEIYKRRGYRPFEETYVREL